MEYRHLIVKISPNRYIVTEPDPPFKDSRKACSKPMKEGPATEMCRILNTAEVADYPAWVQDAMIEL